MSDTNTQSRPEGSGPALIGVLVIFAGLAVAFAADVFEPAAKESLSTPDASAFLAHQNVRDPLGLKLQKAGFEYDCSSCHQHFERPDARQTLVAEHAHIELNHGANNRCLNCHNKSSDMQSYVNHDGSDISASTPEMLCAKCHGPKYRDWKVGVHGRPSGHWDPNLGGSVRTSCMSCHDPHSPAFKPIAPAPAPRDHHVKPHGEDAHHE